MVLRSLVILAINTSRSLPLVFSLKLILLIRSGTEEFTATSNVVEDHIQSTSTGFNGPSSLPPLTSNAAVVDANYQFGYLNVPEVRSRPIGTLRETTFHGSVPGLESVGNTIFAAPQMGSNQPHVGWH